MQQLAAQIPWFHNCLLLDKVKEQAEREWYSSEAACLPSPTWRPN
jgi:hypothetical protein